MVEHNTESMRTAFLVSVDYRHGTTTGISSFDRAATVLALVDPTTRPGDLARPGHILPLEAREGGVLKRAGHTEATVDLARMAGLYPAGILCEIVDDEDGHGPPARAAALRPRARPPHDLDRRPDPVPAADREAGAPGGRGPHPHRLGRLHLLRLRERARRRAARGHGQAATSPARDDVLVRVHSECLTGDVFGSMRCDCGVQLDAAMKQIADEGTGVIMYLRGHEGRGIGIGHKIRAYELQDEGHDTVEANEALGLPIDSREYGIGAQILVDLGITTMRLITNNPAKYGGLDGFGLDITGRVPSITAPNPENIRYLKTKAEKMGHLLEGLEDLPPDAAGAISPESADDVEAQSEADPRGR
jgi:3,4-dihydroxy 2-butanone 4-phosphate synthase/GTP cyclohydrolase II